MAHPPIVLDTNVFRDSGFIWWLKKYRGDRIVPVIVYCELAVHFIEKTGDTAKLDGLLYGAGIAVNEMEREHARRAAEFAQGSPDWHQHWRDYMIAGYAAFEPWLVITENVRDFSCLLGRAIRPADFKAGIEDGSIR